MSPEPPLTVPDIPNAPAAFHLLAKPTGAMCNLDCAYCFFLSKETLYPGSRFRMADEMLETYVRQLVEAHVGAPVVEVAWQGGEPTLMGLPFFRRAVELVDTYLHPGQSAVEADAAPAGSHPHQPRVAQVSEPAHDLIEAAPAALGHPEGVMDLARSAWRTTARAL